MGIKEKDFEYVANTYARFPVELVRGSGSLVYDVNGKEYIDLNSGIAVNSFGIADKEWQAAVTDQLGKLQHTSNLYFSDPCATLAQMLCKRTGMKKVFFSNSGAEANETAVKVARKYAAEKKGAEYFTVITMKNSFHGRTMAMLAATGQDAMHKDFLPLMPGFAYADPDDPSTLEKCVKENKVAAIMFEIVRGEGGVLPLDKSFIELIDRIAKENDILTICDEVQTGNGRTGELYAYMNYGITPDIVTTAKGLGGGLPIGATLLGEKVKDTLTPGSHGSTFGGNPVCCAGACSIISRIDEKLLDEVKQKSKYVFDAFEGAKGIKSVTGLGLMIGVETEKPVADVISACIEKGVLPIKAKEKLRLLPALNIPFELLKKGIEVIKEAAAK